jgi:O-antigen/teichoic acid export membrane protein
MGESTNPEKPAENASTSSLWNQIGFHRPLAGFWHNLFFQIWTIIVPAILWAYLLKLLYPFPEMRGYRTTFTEIFVFVFTLFDLGTNATIERYIADENIRNPSKMVQYIQYFIWYQAITGLIQVTSISIWALYFVKEPGLVFGIWIMLVCVTKQWPGFPSVFKGVLTSLQQFNKSNIIDFVQNQGLQIFTEILFVLLGRWYGMTHPEIGMIMGVAIGATFGLYLDDVLASIIAAYFLAKSLKPYGITFKRMFYIEFDFELVKECTFFGIKMGIPGLLGASIKMVSLLLCLQYIPQYTTFAALAGLAIQLVATAERLVRQDFTPIFTEAYQNGKHKLCQYYNAHALRFFAINSGFAISIMLIVSNMFEYIFLGLKLDYYLFTVPFIIPSLIFRIFKPYMNYPGNILVGAHRPNQLLVINLSMDALRLLSWYLTIVVFRIQDLGMGGVIYILTLTELPVNLLAFVISMTYIHKTVFPLKFMIWQTIMVPIISTAILYSIFLLLKLLLLDALFAWSFWGTLVIGLILIMILVFGFYFPFTALLGGWDDNSLRDLSLAVKMSGISRILVLPMTKLIFKIAPKSSLHNRFKYDEHEAFQEIQELMEIREQNRIRLLNKL